jgi:hypothetical protein
MSTPDIGLDNALKEFRDFLETAPAYVDRQIADLLRNRAKGPPAPIGSAPVVSMGFSLPRIQLYCEHCDGPRGFDCTTANLLIVMNPHYEHVTYRCRDCGETHRTFSLYVAPVAHSQTAMKAMKLGEYPPFGSHVAKRLQNLLSSDDLELYRKGLRSEREGQGIGAAAYYRRVVENQWKALVTRLRDAAKKLGTPEAQLAVFDEALKQTQFSQAVELLKDAIPAKLLILDGKNPLTLLYKPLSVQLHDQTDAQCLQQAADIRVVLNELFDTISRVLADDAALKGAVQRLQGL